MQTFRIIYFREKVMDHTEEIQALDVLEAIDRASSMAPELRAEIWADQRRVCEVGPTRNRWVN